jgi:hypothetical protein
MAPFASSILAYLLIFIQGLSVNGFINSQKLFGSSHLLFVFAYVLFTTLLPEWNYVSPFLLINGLMTLILPKLAQLYQGKNIQGSLFSIAIMIGICSLLYKPAIILVVFLYISLSIFRPFHLSEWILILIGACFPYYLILVYDYVWDRWPEAVYLLPYHSWDWPVFKRNPSDLIAIGLLIIPTLLGFFWVRGYSLRMLAVQRKIWAALFAYIMVAIVFIFASQNPSYENYLLFLLPASFYLTGFFYYPSVKFLPSLFPWLIFGFLVVRNVL